MKSLEQILDVVSSGKYSTIDVYTAGTIALYSGPIMDFNVPLAYNDRAPSPFERQTTLFDYGMQQFPEFKLPEIPKMDIPIIEGPGCIGRNSYELDNGWKLQERFDFSNHDEIGPHLNYDIMNPLGSVQPKLSSKYLDNNHQIDLWKY